MLKIYAEMLKIIISEKALLEKIMRELIEYVFALKNNTYSLVHERAFAMTAIAYLQGDMHSLSEGSVRTRFIQIMNQKDSEGFNATIREQVRRHLERMVLA
jgi:cell division protein ZapA (FtsZ GTPase activity inhibitor)